MRTETVSLDVGAQEYAALHALKDRMAEVPNAPLRLQTIEAVENLVGRRQVRVTLEVDEHRDPRDTLLASLRAEVERSAS